ncbi:MAG: hypothetical protein QXU59_06755 [Pyrobaculum sp.]
MRGLESIEVAVALTVVLAFVLGFVYIFDWFGVSKQQEFVYADLSAAAQQALDRILWSRPLDPSRGLGLGGDGRYIDDSFVYFYATATATPSLQTCKIESKALVNHLGIDEAYLAGRGWLVLKREAASLDYEKILANLFGEVGRWGFDGRSPLQLFDIKLLVTPVATAKCEIRNDYATFRIVSKGPPQDGRVVYSLYYVKKGDAKKDNVLCTAYGIGYTSNGELRLKIGDLQFYCDDGSTARPGSNEPLVVLFEKIDKPTLICYSTTQGDRPFAYGFTTVRDGALALYIVHDSAISCGGGNNAVLGVRYVDLYLGGSKRTVAEDITLDPGVGKGSVKVEPCSSCTKSAHCTACYIANIPREAKVAVVAVETSAAAQAGGGLDIIVVPLVPYPPFMSINITTWTRWGFTREPWVPAAVATRVVDSPSTTYNVTLWVYRRP